VVARGKRKVLFGFNPDFARSKGVRVVRIRARVVATLPNGDKVRRKALIRVRVR
jgi:hypothetical protein